MSIDVCIVVVMFTSSYIIDSSLTSLYQPAWSYPVFYITSSSGELSVAKYSEIIKTEIILLIGYQIFCLQHKPPVILGPLYQTTHITDLAKQLGITQPGVGYAVSRGEKIAKEHNSSYLLIYGRSSFTLIYSHLLVCVMSRKCVNT